MWQLFTCKWRILKNKNKVIIIIIGEGFFLPPDIRGYYQRCVSDNTMLQLRLYHATNQKTKVSCWRNNSVLICTFGKALKCEHGISQVLKVSLISRAFYLSSMNARFGVVAVPTILIFHAGKPVLKFNHSKTLDDLRVFVKNYTGTITLLITLIVLLLIYTGKYCHYVQ